MGRPAEPIGRYTVAHELEVINGQASMLSVGVTPWHRLGVVLPEAPSYTDALQIAKLDYDVVLRDLFWKRETPGDDFVEQKAPAFAAVRSDTEQVLGVVGSTYKAIQNRDAFRVLEPLIDAELAGIETAGVLRDGADAWMLVRFNPAKMGPEWQGMNEETGDIIQPYGLIATNHTGRRGVLLKNTPIRVVCANTLGMAEAGREQQAVVLHRGNAQDRLVAAAQNLFTNTVESYEATAVAYRKLRQTILTEAQFEAAVLDVIAPLPKPGKRFDPSSRMAQTVMARVTERRETLDRLWKSGTGQDGTPTAWAAYNAVTEALDHNIDGGWKVRGERPASLLDGPLAQAKRKVLDKLMAVR